MSKYVYQTHQQRESAALMPADKPIRGSSSEATLEQLRYRAYCRCDRPSFSA